MKLLNLILGTLQAANYGSYNYNSYEYENYGNRPSRRPTSATNSDGLPDYGPISGFTSCLSPGDRVYDNYSMLKEISGSNGKARDAEMYAAYYCKNIYKDTCDIIVKIVRNDQYAGLRMTIQLGSYKTPPCQPRQNDPTITRTIIWNRETRIVPTPMPKAQLSYGPVYGSGHECQLVPQKNKYALNHQFSTFEEAALFCKSHKNICDILVELTLKGGPKGKERKLYETGSTLHASCHCPQQNGRPFKEVVAIWEEDKKKVTKPPCDNTAPLTTVMPVIDLIMYGPVIGQCAPQPILGNSHSPIFLQTVNWKNDPTRAFHNCRNSQEYFGSKCDVIVKYTFNGNDYYEIGETQNATNSCKYNKFKDSAENKQKSIQITVLHKGVFN